MKGTDEQSVIWEALRESENHLMVYAKAGTGKTFTIVEGSKQVSGQKAFLAFNKDIVKDLKKKLPSDVTVKTFHSFGLGAIRSHLGESPRIDFGKTRSIIEGLLGPDYYSYPLVNLVSRVKGTMIDPTDKKKVNGLIGRYQIDFKTVKDQLTAIEILPKVLEKCLEDISRVDYDDMIWIPVKANLPVQTFDVLFVDEAQDFDYGQRMLLKKIVGNGRAVVVGDPRQAIYGFRGATSNSMDLFHRDLETTNRQISKFPLTICWRCPTSVIREANRYVQNFHARPDAERGTVYTDVTFAPKPNDMVLCRYNAPLVNAFYMLVSKGKKANILGRDMSSGLRNYVYKISRKHTMSALDFAELLDTHFEVHHEKLLKEGKLSQANALQDKYECLSIFVCKSNTVGEILNEIKKVFETSDGGVTLSTVHKAKGLENDNVFILATDRMPHPNASDIEEERNICYVAITRAKKNLYYCGPKPGGARFGY